MKLAWLTILLSLGAEARTLWSGSFIHLSKNTAFVEIGINYPAIGAGKICGVELKSQTMILNRRVWQTIANGLQVTARLEDSETQKLNPEVVVAEGPQIFYRLNDMAGSYAIIRIEARSGENLSTYFSRSLNQGGEPEEVIAVAKSCPN